MLALAAALLLAQDLPKPTKEHEWLKQLEGEWTADGDVVPGPGQPPIKMKGSESARSLGGFWLQSEMKSDVMGMAITGVMSLGYDAKKKKYVGTWIDNCGAHLWTYEGAVEGKVLTLESVGPSMEDPEKMVKYREVLEIKTPDHKTFTSSRELDGKYVTFMTIQYHRKK